MKSLLAGALNYLEMTKGLWLCFAITSNMRSTCSRPVFAPLLGPAFHAQLPRESNRCRRLRHCQAMAEKRKVQERGKVQSQAEEVRLYPLRRCKNGGLPG